MRRILGFSTISVLSVAAPAAIVLAHPFALVAQNKTVAIQGRITNVDGTPLKIGDVKLTTDKTTPSAERKYQYSFPISQDGTYKGDGVAPGDYLIVVYADNKTVDYQNVTLKAGEDHTVDFDMTREEYLKSLTPEQRSAIEAAKKKNAGITAENAKIKNINSVLIQARTDEKSGKADDAVKSLSGVIASGPNEAFLSIIYSSLGEAQLAAADQAAAAAHAAKTSVKTPEIQQKYADAAASYQKAVDEAPKSTKPTPPDAMSAIYMNLGTALLKSGKFEPAVTAFDESAKASPANAAKAYGNEAANFYNNGSETYPQAAAAADKAIAADPKNPLPYYIKGQALIPNATVDEKTKKIVAPPGCVEAYQEFVALAPANDPKVAEVKDLLTNLGQPIKSSFRAGKQ